MGGLTASIGEFVSRCDSVPHEAREIAARGLVDAFGCMLAAVNEPVVQALAQLARAHDPPAASSTILLSARRTDPVGAATINASAAHALALDDVAWGCHPSAMLAPALLAEAQALGAGGAALLRAYVVGYEVLAELASREPDPWHLAGWHPSGLLGPIAVAAAIANLHGATPEQAAAALGIASSMSGGVVANFGTPTKAVHVGRAAAAGMTAWRLASAGIVAAADALEHPAGLLRAASPHGRFRHEGEALSPGHVPRILAVGISIKQYPVCYSTHRVVDAAADIGGATGFDAQQVDAIDVHIGQAQAWLARHERPASPPQAKYSVEFAVAAGLLARDAGYAQLTDQFVRSPAVQRLVGLTTRHLRDDRSGDDGVFAASDRVVVRMRDGRVFDSGEVAFARGNAQRPLDDDALRRKFIAAARRGGRDDGAAVFDTLRAVDEITDLRAVMPG